MKKLQLRKIPAGKGFRYQVIEDDRVICERKSDRTYVACLVFQYTKPDGSFSYSGEYYFGRLDLIGKGSSKFAYASGKGYATAYLDLPTE